MHVRRTRDQELIFSTDFHVNKMFQPEPIITYFELNYIVIELFSFDRRNVRESERQNRGNMQMTTAPVGDISRRRKFNGEMKEKEQKTSTAQHESEGTTKLKERELHPAANDENEIG